MLSKISFTFFILTALTGCIAGINYLFIPHNYILFTIFKLLALMFFLGGVIIGNLYMLFVPLKPRIDYNFKYRKFFKSDNVLKEEIITSWILRVALIAIECGIIYGIMSFSPMLHTCKIIFLLLLLILASIFLILNACYIYVT